MLEVIDIHKHFGSKVVLAGVTFSAERSDVVVILGENGSGKSTLLRLLCGILEPTRGDVVIAGHSLRREPRRAKALLGYAPDGMEALPDLLVSELLTLVRTLKSGRGDRPTALETEWKDRLGVSGFWDQRVGALSFGQRKRVGLLAAVCENPRVLLLDEPTNGLDAPGVELVHALIAERRIAGAVTLLSTNDAEFALSLRARRCRISDARLMGDGEPSVGHREE